MKRQGTMQASQLEEFALFLDEHPAFSPALKGADAIVCGFRVGECFLTLAEMEGLIAAKPQFDAREAALPPSAGVWVDGMTPREFLTKLLTDAERDVGRTGRDNS